MKLRTATRLSREQKIACVTAIIVAGFVAACFYYYYLAFYLHLPYPLDTFLSPGLFGDYRAPLEQWQSAEFGAFGLSYFPGTYLFVNLLAKIPDPLTSSFVFVTLFSGIVLVYSYISVKTHDVLASVRDAVICTFMSYPVLFVLATGNLEGLVFIFLALFVYWYEREKYALSCVALALCVSMKFFPIVFAVMYIANKRYKELLYLSLYVIALTVFPLAYFHGGIADGFSTYLSRLHANQDVYVNLMILGIAGTHFGHSLLNGLRILAGPYFPDMHRVLLPYSVFAVAAMLATAGYVIFVERVFWKRIAVITISMCLLPYTSTDYKLIYFVIPLYLFVNHRKSEEERSSDIILIVLFALLMVPKSFAYLWGDPYNSVSIIISPLLMLAILCHIVASGVSAQRRRRQLSF